MYLEVAKTGNLGLIVIKGNPKEEKVAEQWEEIVRKNAEANGQGLNDLDNIEDYRRLLSTYIGVRASLLQLCLVVDDDCIAFLESKGYKIDQSCHSGYISSINSALHKVRNVLSKLASRHKFITESMKVADKATPLQSSAESMIANISAALGFNVEPTVTLARFNEYNKIIKKRIDAQKRPKVA